jgi:hypothetical protein
MTSESCRGHHSHLRVIYTTGFSPVEPVRCRYRPAEIALAIHSFAMTGVWLPP